MTDTTDGAVAPAAAPAQAPAATTTQAQAQAQPQTHATPPAAAAEYPSEPAEVPKWVAPRLEKAATAAERKLLERLGVSSTDEAAEKLKRLGELETAQLSEQERQAKQLEELTTRATRSEGFEKKFTELVDARFEALPEDQRQRIDAKANGDASKRFDFMEVMGLMNGPVAPPPPKPASTTPASATPAPPPAGAPQSPFERWQALESNPRTRQQAAIYRQANLQAIEASAPSQT